MLKLSFVRTLDINKYFFILKIEIKRDTSNFYCNITNKDEHQKVTTKIMHKRILPDVLIN